MFSYEYPQDDVSASKRFSEETEASSSTAVTMQSSSYPSRLNVVPEYLTFIARIAVNLEQKKLSNKTTRVLLAKHANEALNFLTCHHVLLDDALVDYDFDFQGYIKFLALAGKLTDKEKSKLREMKELKEVFEQIDPRPAVPANANPTEDKGFSNALETKSNSNKSLDLPALSPDFVKTATFRSASEPQNVQVMPLQLPKNIKSKDGITSKVFNLFKTKEKEELVVPLEENAPKYGNFGIQSSVSNNDL